jgi:DNA-binding CsgD family transcriptional regulator
MPKGPKPADLQLSEEERKELEALVRRHSTPQQLAKRGRMILRAGEGKRNAEIAREMGVSVDTVRSWRGRYFRSLFLLTLFYHRTISASVY